MFLAQLRLVHGQAQDALDVVARIGPVIDPLLAVSTTRVRAAPFKISELRHRGEALLDLGQSEAGLRSLQEAVALADMQASADSRNIFWSGVLPRPALRWLISSCERGETRQRWRTRAPMSPSSKSSRPRNRMLPI